jgi:hypothetical protein
MIRLLGVLLALLSLKVATAQIHAPKLTEGLVGNNQFITLKRQIGHFDRLQVTYALKVNIQEGDADWLELKGESNVLPYVNVENKNGELRVSLSRKIPIKESKAITLTIHTNKLKQIQASMACLIKADVPLVADLLTVQLDTASALEATLAVKRLELRLSASSRANLQGAATEAQISLVGACTLTADQLVVSRLSSRLSNVSKATITVKDQLSARLESISTLTYSGRPTVDYQQTDDMSKLVSKR